jgi:putative oxidoreductase
MALLAGAGELVGGFLIASGLLTPLGITVLAAVMTVAILTVHLCNGI